MAIDAVIDSWTPPKFRDGDLASLLCARVCVCARGLGRAWGVRVCASVCVCAGRRGRGGGGYRADSAVRRQSASSGASTASTGTVRPSALCGSCSACPPEEGSSTSLNGSQRALVPADICGLPVLPKKCLRHQIVPVGFDCDCVDAASPTVRRSSAAGSKATSAGVSRLLILFGSTVVPARPVAATTAEKFPMSRPSIVLGWRIVSLAPSAPRQPPSSARPLQ